MTTTTSNFFFLNTSIHFDSNSGKVLDIRIFETPAEALTEAIDRNYELRQVGYSPEHRACILQIEGGILGSVIGLDFDASITTLRADIAYYNDNEADMTF